MGSCLTSTERKQSMHLEKKMEQSNKINKQEKTILVLGEHLSGKSTVLKHLTKHYKKEFSDELRNETKKHIGYQLKSEMKKMIEKVKDYKMDIHGSINKEQAQILLNNHNNDNNDSGDDLKEDGKVLSKEEGKRLSNLWKDDAIQNIFQKRNEYYGVSDSTEYFFNKMDDIVADEYSPNDKDVFLARYRSTAPNRIEQEVSKGKMVFIEFPNIGKTDKNLVDMFDNVTVILYVFSLTCWDEVMENDKDKNICNGMNKSLETLQKYAMTASLCKIPFIIVLSKQDLLEQKLNNTIDDSRVRTQFKSVFPDFNLEMTKDNVCEYIANIVKECGEQRYVKSARKSSAMTEEIINETPTSAAVSPATVNKPRDVYIHVSTAADTKLLTKCWNDIQHMVLSDSLSRGGLL